MQLNRMLDTLDDLVDSEVVSSNVDYYSRDGKAEQRPLEETAGIPTGIAPDIAVQIQRRRNRKQQTPDNLVAPQQSRFSAGQNQYPAPARLPLPAGAVPYAANALSAAARPVSQPAAAILIITLLL